MGKAFVCLLIGALALGVVLPLERALVNAKECQDHRDDCKTFKGCDDPKSALAATGCLKTCGFCGSTKCQDYRDDCQSFQGCNDPKSALAATGCLKTCGFC
ncbi:uncharacterized protein LOC117114375 [Anneissia japonica]|uniref:uncharacterized protein LOC117114375 n=1 Tax=Anneissia japonica TaxID=1529436 RepID=UPI0014259F05|nr:uncharacterized protein LOC117114375 [Anneissia japonica]